MEWTIGFFFCRHRAHPPLPLVLFASFPLILPVSSFIRPGAHEIVHNPEDYLELLGVLILPPWFVGESPPPRRLMIGTIASPCAHSPPTQVWLSELQRTSLFLWSLLRWSRHTAPKDYHVTLPPQSVSFLRNGWVSTSRQILFQQAGIC